ncbi:aminotransferase class V-fold PLP-dependent enzyme [Sneathiella sp. CAU 1612]|uniref:Aminotransferase class V-fold PLP-dependent enzyme n=1 Tax=Sneathiella sedimenti TaxID=2816034 RepID=A0ABS3F4J0_9PROT|nr:aminotransferase class V-fold PLP-dependent enzyme [Sneathiella sedimenti]MBO0333434.1 aminotransferase class V-fold PLP-dependent enzyme [Sneathiella sedimenti]
MIPSQRHLFDIPDDIAYFNCAYMGPLTKTARAAGHGGIDRKSLPWTVAPSDFFTESEQARSLFATLVGTAADNIAIIPSASYGLAIAARNLPLEAGEKILLIEDQFPSNVYCWQERAKECGAEIVTVSTPADRDWTSAVLNALDERVAIAALPHIHWTDGARLDLEAIGAKLRSNGGKLVLDVTQSLGALPLDLEKVRPDFLIAAAYKWLLGPYSVGFLYVAPAHQDGDPLEYNWLNRKGSEDFAGLVDYVDVYQQGARRYDMGERANFALMPVAVAALEQILDWGVADIQETLTQKTRDIAARCAGLGLTSLPDDMRAGHFLGLRRDGGLPKDLLDRLRSENILVSVRGSSMRITPHLFNNEADSDRLLAALENIL